MTTPNWVIIIPQKNLRHAKSRLQLDTHDRQAIARALLRDTITAAHATPTVNEIIVVHDHPHDLNTLHDLDIHPLLAHRPGLNEALRQAEHTARTTHPHCAVAALPADLPLIEPAVLSRALTYAHTHDRAFLTDTEHRGTTLLTARPGQTLQPAYGTESRKAHHRSGAHELTQPDLAAMRFDLDHLTHLRLISPHINHPNLTHALNQITPHAYARMLATHTICEEQAWIC
jgi:2-phospho-L-lactate guanylyltransferase